MTLKIAPARLAWATLAGVAFALFVPFTVSHAQEFDRQLGAGMQGDDVAVLQAFLAGDPTIYPQGLVTGYFGPLTQAAVTRWQQREGIAQTGVVEMRTLAALNDDMEDGGSDGGSTGIGGSDDTEEPDIRSVRVVEDEDSATISWVTDEDTKGRVLYGEDFPFTTATARSSNVSGTYGTVHAVELTDLEEDTEYDFVIEAEDISGNIRFDEGQFETEED